MNTKEEVTPICSRSTCDRTILITINSVD